MDVVVDNLGFIFRGLVVTVRLTLLSWVGAFLIGVTLATCRVSPIPPLRGAAATYVTLVRNTPLLVLFFLFFFGFPKLGIQYPAFPSAVIVLAVYTGAFVGEAIRAGLNTVARGQAEAARSIGLTFPQVLAIVVLPQALRSVVAPLGNLFIALTKNSSVAFSISVVELTGVSSRLITRFAQPLPTLFGIAVGYLLLTYPSGLAFGALERRLAVRR
ncbi:MAG: amino acid ABC transporter permease [Actinomycetota bacterium]|nr:amino acid ABC transporter permease [Actinomycetota bacterium]